MSFHFHLIIGHLAGPLKQRRFNCYRFHVGDVGLVARRRTLQHLAWSQKSMEFDIVSLFFKFGVIEDHSNLKLSRM